MGDKKLGYQYYWRKDHNQHVALRIFADQPQHAEISRSFDDSSTLDQEWKYYCY